MSIVGECPHCDKIVWRVLPECALPKFSKEDCPECGKRVWVLYSRIDPQVFTEEQFAERYIVDEANKSITERTAKAKEQER